MQLDIAKELTGNCKPGTIDDLDPAILPTFKIQRRKRLFKQFFIGDDQEATRYRNYDVPSIAKKYLGIWKDVKMSSPTPRRRSFAPNDLLFIESEFRIVLVACNIIGKFHVDPKNLVPHQSTRTSRVRVARDVPTCSSTTVPQQDDVDVDALDGESPTPTRSGSTASDGTSTSTFPNNLRSKNLQCTQDGVILWDMVAELASIEYLFTLHVKDGIAWDALEHAMKKNSVAVPNTFEPSELCSLTETNKSNAMKNISLVRDDFMLHMGGNFLPQQHEPLHMWL